MADIFSICCGPIGIVALFILLPTIFTYIRIILQFEKGIVFRLGKFQSIREPGLILLIPFIDRMVMVDTRIQALDIPKQETLTKDNISVFLNAVIYYRILDPKAAILKVQDYQNAIFQHGQAAMRDIAGSVELDTLLSDRDKVAGEIRKTVNKETHAWGIEVVSLNIQDIELPSDMKKAMARQAQAERDKRASIIISKGEVEASETLARAAEVISAAPGALHLRTLQALSNLSADKTNTITYVLPIEGQVFPEGGSEAQPKVSIKKK